jgi:Asp-tRNA(Asn)/Glu-tRNA(Gln) amidotransferase A subunit family amidase
LIAAYKQQDALRAALVELIDKYQLDALVLPFRTAVIQEIPAQGDASLPEARNSLSSYTGLPTIIVPGGFFPGDGMPFGVQFLGRPFTEPTLIKLASGYEAATRHRRAPSATPALSGEKFDY